MHVPCAVPGPAHFRPSRRSSLSAFVGLAVFVIGVAVTDAEEPPVPLKSLGGHWYVSTAKPQVYYYKDADRYLDLFSAHTKDFNKDGIPNLRVGHDAGYILIESQGLPDHPTGIFPNTKNPNTIRPQTLMIRLPLEPRMADQITRLPMGPCGLAANGVAFFNPFEMEGMNAVEGYREVWLDSCCGHPQQQGMYHYHKYPTCIKSPFKDDGKQHSPVIGFAFDGFPVYGPYESNGVMAKDLKGMEALDACNGHRDAQRGYHYHVTPGRFPYITGGYAGIPEASNSRGLRRAEVGALQDNTQPGVSLDPAVGQIRPGNLVAGKTQRVMIELIPAAARRPPIPPSPPATVHIGPYEGTHIQRQGNLVSAEFTIPADADLAIWLDCHLEFRTQHVPVPVAIKKNDVARVVAEQ